MDRSFFLSGYQFWVFVFRRKSFTPLLIWKNIIQNFSQITIRIFFGKSYLLTVLACLACLHSETPNGTGVFRFLTRKPTIVLFFISLTYGDTNYQRWKLTNFVSRLFEFEMFSDQFKSGIFCPSKWKNKKKQKKLTSCTAGEHLPVSRNLTKWCEL